MKKVIIILSICMATTGCSSKTQPTKLSYDNPYDLTRLDFSMNVPEFMSGSIVLKRFVSDDENVDRDSESKINGSTGMYHFCHWVDEKLSERNYLWTMRYIQTFISSYLKKKPNRLYVEIMTTGKEYL